MLDEAVKTVTSAGHYRAVRGVLANAMQLPFEGGRFDALCAMHMLYHLPDPAQALGEMRRVLRPGGAFLVYQFRARARDYLARHFERIDNAFEWVNVPPCYLYWGWKD